MVAGFIKLHIKLNKVDEAVRLWNARITDAKKHDVSLHKLDGFLFMIDRKTGHGYSLGFWESAEDSRAFKNSRLFAELLGEIEKFCIRTPVREELEVVGGDLTRLRTEKLAA